MKEIMKALKFWMFNDLGKRVCGIKPSVNYKFIWKKISVEKYYRRRSTP